MKFNLGEMEEWRDVLGHEGVALLAAFRSFTNKDGVCWPSIATLSDRSGLGRTKVKSMIRVAVETGLLQKAPRQEHKPRKGRPVNAYQLSPRI